MLLRFIYWDMGVSMAFKVQDPAVLSDKISGNHKKRTGGRNVDILDSWCPLTFESLKELENLEGDALVVLAVGDAGRLVGAVELVNDRLRERADEDTLELRPCERAGVLWVYWAGFGGVGGAGSGLENPNSCSGRSSVCANNRSSNASSRRWTACSIEASALAIAW